MEQNANESSVNVCVIQLLNRAGWLTMRDRQSCIRLFNTSFVGMSEETEKNTPDERVKISFQENMRP